MIREETASKIDRDIDAAESKDDAIGAGMYQQIELHQRVLEQRGQLGHMPFVEKQLVSMAHAVRDRQIERFVITAETVAYFPQAKEQKKNRTGDKKAVTER